MVQEHSFEIRDRARELYVDQGLTYAQAAAQINVSERTVKRWAKKYGWSEEKKQRMADRLAFDRTQRDLRLAMMQTALKTRDPKDVMAAIKLENMALAWEKARRLSEQLRPAFETREIRTPQDAIDALRDAAELKINRLLSQPETLDPAALKDVQKVFELIEDFKTRYEPEDGKPADKGLSAKAVDDIKQRILGITT